MSVHLLRLVVCLPLVLLCSACSELRYYGQSAGGQLDIVQRRQPVDTLIAAPDTDAQLRRRLQHAREMRAFAIAELALPDTGSYTYYADLERDFAVLALYAAPEFSTGLKTWCYPVAGCANYRGYFDRGMLDADVGELQRQDYDVYIARVPAYSTLGWFDDPLLNTVLDWPESQMAGLIFHELAHQRLYVKGDTVFNESFATAVERAGVERWLAARGRSQEVQVYRRRWRDRERVVALVAQAREDLDVIYRSGADPQSLRRAKQRRLDELREQYRALRTESGADPGYDAWFADELNNARLGSLAAYHAYVDAFLALLARHCGDMEAFYEAAARTAALQPGRRAQALAELARDDQPLAGGGPCATALGRPSE
jgi:predicted aminopeptidase